MQIQTNSIYTTNTLSFKPCNSYVTIYNILFILTIVETSVTMQCYIH